MQNRMIPCLLLAALPFMSSIVFAAAGRTAGQFSVSPTGSANYTIPLWSPPGVRGLQPRLALTYDSNAGAGILGPGWNVAGLSAITRCAPTFAQDGTPGTITLTAADRFCLDGKRLRLTSSENLSTYGAVSTTYQTEIADFSQITASSTASGNGPAYFTVQGKNGLTYEYGNTTDSRVFTSAGGTPYTWALDKVTDRYGNYMTYTYQQASGSYTISSIQYTALNGSTSFPYQIVFTYGTQTATVKYISGSQVLNTQLLAQIAVNYGNTQLHAYSFAYTASATTQRQTLTSIQECVSGTGGDCLAATTVGYQSGTEGVANPATGSGSAATSGLMYSFDINGDGHKDLVYATLSGSTYHWYVQFATGSSFGTAVDTGISSGPTDPVLFDDFLAQGKISILVPQSGIWTLFSWNGSAFVSTSSGLAVDSGRQPSTNRDFTTADVNGDGLPDLVDVLANGGIYVRLNTSANGRLSFSSTTSATSAGGISGTMQIAGNNQFPMSAVQHIDVNGDGRDDIVYSGNVNTNCHLVNGSYVCTQVPQFKVFVANGTGFTAGINLGVGGAPTNFVPMNFNDDACTDFLIPSNNEIYIAGCNGAAATTIAAPANIVAFLDWDGDGKTDLLVNVSGSLDVYKSQGTALSGAISTGLATPTGALVVTDPNGDGLDDLAYAKSNSGYAIYFGLHNGAGTPPDRMSSLVDGYGNSVTPTYVSIADGAYTPYSDATFPYENYIGPLYVVSQAIFSDPTNPPNATYNVTFGYFGAWMNVQGRGFQGFYAKQTNDSRYTTSPLSHYEYYERSFPYAGLKFQDIVSTGAFYAIQATGTPASLSAATLDGTAYNQRYFPYMGNLTITQKELGGAENGTLVTTTSTNYIYDAYGNATNISTTVTDNDPGSPYAGYQWLTTTAVNVTPNTSAWCVGLPTQVQVTKSSTAPGGGAITRTTAFTPDYTHCVQTQKVTEPNNSKYQVTENYTYDPNTGNLTGDSITGVAMSASPATRTTSYAWNTTGQFLSTITDPSNAVVTLTFDPAYGTLTSMTDPSSTSTNRIASGWRYDGFARKTLETRPDGTSTSWTYTLCSGCDPLPRLVVAESVQDTSNNVITTTTYYSDMMDRPLYALATLLDGTTVWSSRRYDSWGRLASVYFPYRSSGSSIGTTTYGYDSLGRTIQVQRPINASSGTLESTTFAYAGRTQTQTDPLGHNTTWTKSVTGALLRTKDNNGYYVSMTRDAFDSVVSVTDSASNTLRTMSYLYGVDAFLQSSTDNDRGPTSYSVDALGELTAWTDAKGQTFSMTYDALSRPSVRTEPDLTTTWTWGNTAANYNVGKLQSVSAANSLGAFSESYGYDSKARLASKTITIPSDATYTYNYSYNASTGFPDTLQYPASTAGYQLKLQYTYAHGLLKAISDAASGTPYWTANAVDARGHFTQEALGNGVVVTSAFDGVTGWLSSVQAGIGGGAALQNSSFLFDAAGNLSQRQDNNQGLTENFYYDGLNRLQSSQLNGATNNSFTYDATGNISTALTDGSSITDSRNYTTAQTGCTYYSNPQIHAVRSDTHSTTVTSFCYDPNGNTIAVNVNGVAYGLSTWTSFNQPSGINSSTSASQFFYDGNHQRYKQIASYSGTQQTTFYIGGLLEKVVTSAGTAYRHYIPAGNNEVVYIRSSTGANLAYYLTTDHLGSTAVITDETGALAVAENFSPLGARRGDNWTGSPTSTEMTAITGITQRGFTGHEMLDNLKFVNMNGRVYGSGGTFLSPDPMGPDLSNTQSFNGYSYVNNNPLTWVDPTGFCGEPDSKKLQSVGGSSDQCLPPITVTSSFEGSFDINAFIAQLFNFVDALANGLTPPASASPASSAVANGTPAAQSQNPITKFRNFICSAPAVSVGLKLQLNYGFLSLFGAEGQVSLSVTSHGQFVWTQTGGGVVGVNQGLILSGGAQGGYSSQDAPSGFSTVSTLGGEVIATAGEGFGASASASTDGSGLSVDALGSGSFGTGVGLVSGANYQTGLAVATPSLCP